MNNKSIELSLRTWYPKDHPLHYDLHHPLGKLVGEWGELLDDYMKHLYKPGYEWQPLDELVDIWYYIRILAYQCNMLLDDKTLSQIHSANSSEIDYLISRAIFHTNAEFSNVSFNRSRYYDFNITNAILHSYSALSEICDLSSLTINQLTEASWEKLKPGSERGKEWMKTTEFNWSEYDEEIK